MKQITQKIMKIGIIGSGNMGRTLGLTWLESGHEVFFGSRNRQDIDYIRSVYSGALQYGDIETAVAKSDVLLYSLRDTLPSAVAPPELWTGKIIIDCNNGPMPADFDYPVSTQSYTEKYQENLPSARVVKAFNCNAQELYNHPVETICQHNIIGFMAGNSTEAKQTVAILLQDAGLQPVDAGLACNARQLESFADLVRLLMVKNQLGPYLVFTADVLPHPVAIRKGERKPGKYA